jgi:hypothetical protein
MRSSNFSLPKRPQRSGIDCRWIHARKPFKLCIDLFGSMARGYTAFKRAEHGVANLVGIVFHERIDQAYGCALLAADHRPDETPVT